MIGLAQIARRRLFFSWRVSFQKIKVRADAPGLPLAKKLRAGFQNDVSAPSVGQRRSLDRPAPRLGSSSWDCPQLGSVSFRDAVSWNIRSAVETLAQVSRAQALTHNIRHTWSYKIARQPAALSRGAPRGGGSPGRAIAIAMIGRLPENFICKGGAFRG